MSLEETRKDVETCAAVGLGTRYTWALNTEPVKRVIEMSAVWIHDVQERCDKYEQMLRNLGYVPGEPWLLFPPRGSNE